MNVHPLLGTYTRFSYISSFCVRFSLELLEAGREAAMPSL